MPNRSAMGRNASAICARGMPKPSSSHSTRWRKIHSSASVCWSAWMMLPSFLNRKSETAATRPFWSGQERSRTAVTPFAFISYCVTRLYPLAGAQGSGQSLSHVHRLGYTSFAMASPIELYDTTLRDGTQMEGISLSVEDKLKIPRKLDELGVHYIEGGWPGSNPKDAEFFARASAPGGLVLRNARLAAFGSTRRAGSSAESDLNLRALVDAGTPVVTIVGKAHDRHVTRILETTTEENLAMIADSIRYLKSQG